jgi:hypothetical protein
VRPSHESGDTHDLATIVVTSSPPFSVVDVCWRALPLKYTVDPNESREEKMGAPTPRTVVVWKLHNTQLSSFFTTAHSLFHGRAVSFIAKHSDVGTPDSVITIKYINPFFGFKGKYY